MPPLPQALKAYQSNSIETQSPGVVILMLYDGALRFMRQAEQGFQEPNWVRRNEQVHNNLLKAQRIITELNAVLDFSADEAFCQKISYVYNYINDQLREANALKSEVPLQEAQRHLGIIRDAWAQMIKGQSNQSVAALSPQESR